MRVELFDLSMAELARTERALPGHGSRSYDVGVVAGHILDGVAEVLAAHGPAQGPSELLGVGIGVPGIVERTADGTLVHGQTVGWDAVPLEALLRRSGRLGPHVPLFIENGARTLGQAEMWFGGGRGAHNAVVVLFGSGVGACVVTDEVEQGRAVEWGHLTVRVRGRRCRCGARGCLEAYAGAEALLARWREAGGEPPPGTDEEAALTAMLAAARPGDGGAPDPVAARVLAETAEYLGAGLADLVNLLPARADPGGRLGRAPTRPGVPGVGTGPHAGPRPAAPRRTGGHRARPARPRRGDGGRRDPAAGGVLRPRRPASAGRLPRAGPGVAGGARGRLAGQRGGGEGAARGACSGRCVD
ncbi:hypothetical protein SVIOM342S_01383 [Streptomyces violaceorubidus]